MHLVMPKALLICASLLPLLPRAAYAAPAPATTGPTTAPARVVSAADLGEPTRISLHMINAPPTALVEALERQTGVPFERDHFTDFSLRHRRKPVTLTLDNATLLDALRQALPALGMSLDPQYGPHPVLTTVPKRDDFGKHPRIDVGPITMELLSVVYARRVAIDKLGGRAVGDTTPERFEVFMRVFVEPKVRVARISNFPAFEEATDEHGQSLLLKNYTVSGVYPIDADGPLATLYFPLNLKLGERSARLARLAGTIKLLRITASHRQEIDLAGLPAPVDVDAGNTRLVVHPMETRDNLYVIRVDRHAYEEQLSKAHLWWQQDVMAGLVAPYDADNRRMPRPIVNDVSRDRDKLGERFELLFRTASRVEKFPPPQKLVWDIPTAFEEIEVPFEFRDVHIEQKLERVLAPQSP